MMPTPATLPSLSWPVPMTSWFFMYDLLTEEKTPETCFIDGSSEYASTTSKWTVAALQLLSGIAHEDSGENKPSQWTELWAVHLFVHFTLKEKRAGMHLYPDSQVVATVWLDDQGLGRSMTGKWMMKKFQDEVC